MQAESLDHIQVSACRLEPVWVIHVELGPEDDDCIRQALCDEVRLTYGDYDHVSLETAIGTQFFRGAESTASGPMESATSRQARVLSFSITKDSDLLDAAMSVIHRLHSYEEPVIYVQDAFASRSLPEKRENENKWWMNTKGAAIR
ncbi:hypothetical protein [Ruegeria sp. Ofav3-42]|uniref:hypothetical protein n=1 Tax=Ruegeria sp. Ofav3-42 TaxID=2917759 RepID=UPI001EF45FD7|nr:hypothetical protein [Ruegeria sp. Ofav3-42]MCG7521503.1 hypothetical protein [Ruegeria sp. Ofav3-42]